jgi:hypothetical protein
VFPITVQGLFGIIGNFGTVTFKTLKVKSFNTEVHRGSHRGSQGKSLRDYGYGAFRAYDQGSALGKWAYGVELDSGFFAGADAGGIFGWAEIEDEFGAYYKEADMGLVVVQVFFVGIFYAAIIAVAIIAVAIIGGSGEVGLGVDFGESPGLAAVVGEG